MPVIFEGGSPTFGALSGVARDNLYWFGSRGMFFTSPWVVTSNTTRHSAVLLLTAGEATIEVSTARRVVRGGVVGVAPLVRRGLRAMDAGLISLHLFPPHPLFRSFLNIPAPGVIALDRAPLARFDESIRAAYEGRLDLTEAQLLFEELLATAVEQLPAGRKRTEPSSRLHELLQQNPAVSLPELAAKLGLSYSGTSRHFSRTVGLPLRSYQLWLKYYIAADAHMRGTTWTDAAHTAGFSDSSHLVKTWQASYGFPPSYTADRKHVRIFIAEQNEYTRETAATD